MYGLWGMGWAAPLMPAEQNYEWRTFAAIWWRQCINALDVAHPIVLLRDNFSTNTVTVLTTGIIFRECSFNSVLLDADISTNSFVDPLHPKFKQRPRCSCGTTAPSGTRRNITPPTLLKAQVTGMCKAKANRRFSRLYCISKQNRTWIMQTNIPLHPLYRLRKTLTSCYYWTQTKFIAWFGALKVPECKSFVSISLNEDEIVNL